MLVRDAMGTNEGKQLKYFQLMEDLKAKILAGEIHEHPFFDIERVNPAACIRSIHPVHR